NAMRALGLPMSLLDEGALTLSDEETEVKVTCDQNRYDRNGRWIGGQVFDTARPSSRDQQLRAPSRGSIHDRRGGRDQDQPDDDNENGALEALQQALSHAMKLRICAFSFAATIG